MRIVPSIDAIVAGINGGIMFIVSNDALVGQGDRSMIGNKTMIP